MTRPLRIAMIADIHGQLPNMAAFEAMRPDLVIFAGDLMRTRIPAKLWALGKNHGSVDELIVADQRAWLSEHFAPLLAQIDLPAERKIVVAGNHDRALELDEGEELIRSFDCTYLVNEAHEVRIGDRALLLWGSPYTPTFQDWSFMASDQALARLWEDIPELCDIVISHGPPWGVVDAYKWQEPEARHLGSHSLLREVLVKEPQLLVCGHIHAGGGQSGMVGVTTVVNASAQAGRCDEDVAQAIDGDDPLRLQPWTFADLHADGRVQVIEAVSVS